MRWLVLLVLAACGSRARESPPPPVTNDTPADKLVAVGRGDRHACVVRASGAVDCWGPPPDPTIRRVSGIADAVGISANATCFLRRGGEVACLGTDTWAAVPLAGIMDARIGAPKTRCFIDGKGGVTCIDDDGKPWKVPNVTDAVAIDSGEYSACIVRKVGTIACGSIQDHSPFRAVEGLDRVTEIAMVGKLENHACAVTGGRVRCFRLEAFPDPKLPFEPEFVHDGQSMDLPKPEAFVAATQLAMWNAGEGNFMIEAVVGGTIVQTNYSVLTVLPALTDAVIHTRECAIRAQGSLVCWGPGSPIDVKL